MKMNIKQAAEQKDKLFIEEKMIWLKKQLEKSRISFVDDREVIIINRERILEESFDAFQSMIELNLNKELQIYFIGEKAQDAGGVQREWMNLLIQKLFEKHEGMFMLTKNKKEGNKYVFGQNVHKHLQWFYFTGQVIGKALYDDVQVQFPLSNSVYQFMINKDYQVTLCDLIHYDEDLYRSFKYMLDDNMSSEDILSLETYFTIDIQDEKGKTIDTRELKEGGKDIQVTNENKEEYVFLFVNHLLNENFKLAQETFLEGFHSVIHPQYLKIFIDGEELRYILEGP